MGGLVTSVAVEVGLKDPSQPNNPLYLNFMEHLKNVRFLQTNARLLWLVHHEFSNETKPLPFTTDTLLKSYLLSGTIPTHPPLHSYGHPFSCVHKFSRFEPRPQLVGESNAPLESQTSQTFHSDSFKGHVIAQFAALRLSQETMQGSLDAFWSDFNRSQLPWYQMEFDCNMVFPGSDCPSFFPELPTDYCQHRVHLSRVFDNLMLGENGLLYNYNHGPSMTSHPSSKPPAWQAMVYARKRSRIGLIVLVLVALLVPFLMLT